MGNVWVLGVRCRAFNETRSPSLFAALFPQFHRNLDT
ncbi:hypothetical protein L8106_30075 [Lyngbya sp. PCC 8106]|nr:hypothetical protein L8106_30075 [Lyngbya sp. PCC 8106]